MNAVARSIAWTAIAAASLEGLSVSAETQVLEAETARGVDAPLTIHGDATASGGRYVALRADLEADARAAVLTFPFTLDEAATVRTFVKIKRHAKPGEAPAQELYDRSLEVRWDDGPWEDWTIENLGHLFWNYNSHDYPAWAATGMRDNFVERFGRNPLWKNNLAAGEHRLQIRFAPHAAGIGIDEVIITTDMDYRPKHPSSERGVIFCEDFERDFSEWLWETVSQGDTEISTNYARTGECSARIELNYRGDTTHREELMLHGIAPRDGERWVAFSMLFPKGGDEDWGVDSKNNDVIFQVHAFPDPDENWVVPPISMNSSNGDWMIFLATDSDTSLAEKEYDFIGPIWRAPYETGVWTDWVFHFKFDHRKENPKGLLEVWKDGEKVVDMHDVQIGQNDIGASNVKTGVYKTRWRQRHDAETDVRRRVVYVDALRLGAAAAKFEDFRLPPKPTPDDVQQRTRRLPIVRQSEIRLSSTFDNRWPLESLVRYAEGRDFKKQEIVDEHSSLMNDVDERFVWLSQPGQTKGEVRFDFSGPQRIDALLLWPFPSYDATLAFPFVRSADEPTHGGRADPSAAAQSARQFTVTLYDASGERLYESPVLTARASTADNPRIEAQVFPFGRAYEGVASACVRVISNHGAARTGLSAVAFRTAATTGSTANRSEQPSE